MREQCFFYFLFLQYLCNELVLKELVKADGSTKKKAKNKVYVDTILKKILLKLHVLKGEVCFESWLFPQNTP